MPDKNKSDSGERVTCDVCGMMYCARVPKGGDGSVRFPRRHRVHCNIRGISARFMPYCNGSFLACREDQHLM